ncbi:hypothetical protein [Streptomyces cavernicola]|uniref:Uncharacterized protein n=1 Tax=Streptomyces cavernicola TaxID=3043613 RepID=A0ABT6SEM0_9ACTN|nr:hypothetical protein [Streptomyces sp. B-S-A6]MDI3405746.1 hypothetical protein [Streptomyces sp. B-S-A6]
MSHGIARLLDAFTKRVLPSRRHHRPSVPSPTVQCLDAPTLHLPRVPVSRGEDTALVRPYLVAFERHQEAQRQKSRRRALWLAVHGVDVGPRHIHGVEVPA